jgi:DNA-binding NtrC family response regulator
MPARRLPTNPNLEHLKKQAKQLVKEHGAEQVDAFARIKASFPRLSSASVREILAADFTLCNAQLVVAREHGFATWKELTEAVTISDTSPVQGVLIDDNPCLRWVQAEIAQAASTELPVLIAGERGTGKGLAARAIHRLSSRRDGTFLQVNCDVNPGILVESELFGHEEGAFTGARARRVGKVEGARRGTIYLDEIGRLSRAAQGKLIRFLEDGTFERLGGSEILQADVRVIAATDPDLQEMVSEGVFRQELAFILQKILLQLPPLRERQEDIPRLAAHFIEQMAAHLGREAPRLMPEAEKALQAHDWPGNVGELEYRVQKAVAEFQGMEIRREDIGM